MNCPRCGNEWDVSRGACTRCGLAIRVPNQNPSGPLGRTPIPPTQPAKGNAQQSGGMPPVRQQPGGSSGTPANGMPFQQSMPPQPPNSLRGTNAVPRTPTATPIPPATSFSTAQNSNAPFNFSAMPVPETPHPGMNTNPPAMPDYERRSTPPMSSGPTSQSMPGQKQAFHSVSSVRPHADPFAPRNVPSRPQPGMPTNRSTDSLIPDLQRGTNIPRANRLVTDPLARDIMSAPPQRAYEQQAAQQPSPFHMNGAASTQNPPLQKKAPGVEAQQLMPGTILRSGRYRIQELQERQDWLSGAYEATWIGQDAQRGASQVMICEVSLPNSNSMVVQSILRSATMALTSVGRHPHIASLSDAFSDRGRHFFVFEPVEGDSLAARMLHTGRAMQEQDVIECLLQMTEVLELLAQQTPPLVHGLIRPEHIMVGSNSAQFALTGFSIVLAGGATQFVSGIDRTRLSAYTSPELVRGVIDVRTDLFSLIATAYHAVTGSMPASVSGTIPAAQRLNPNVSAQFDAILAKGLRPIANQRYQRPSELRQDLLTMRSVNSTLVSGMGQHFDVSATRVPELGKNGLRPEPISASRVPDSVAQAFQALAPAEDFEEQRLLLPLPEELPPLQESNDALHAAIWLGSMLVALILIVVLSRGFF